jgi:hypothetical protein
MSICQFNITDIIIVRSGQSKKAWGIVFAIFSKFGIQVFSLKFQLVQALEQAKEVKLYLRDIPLKLTNRTFL